MKTFQSLILFFILCLAWSCSPSIATYDQHSYTQNAALKVEVLNVVKKSSEPYSKYEAEINKVLLDVQKAREYDIHKPKNAVMTKLWEILWKRIQSTEKKQGASGPITIGFFPFWKEKDAVSPVLAEEAALQIGQMFDTILDLEAGKIRESEVQPGVLEKFIK